MSSAVTTQVTELQNYINGAWRHPSSTEFFDVTNPATTEIIARTPMSDTRRCPTPPSRPPPNAFPAWRRTPPASAFSIFSSSKISSRKSYARRTLPPNHSRKRQDLRRSQSRTPPRHRKRRSRVRHPDDDAGLQPLEDVTPGVDEKCKSASR